MRIFCALAATIQVAPACVVNANAHEATPNLAARYTRHDNRHQGFEGQFKRLRRLLLIVYKDLYIRLAFQSATSAITILILARGTSRQHLSGTTH